MSNTIDVCQTGYDYEQFQLNELENENMKLKKQLEIATKALKKIKRPEKDYLYYIIDKDGNKIDLRSSKIAANALKEIKGVR